MYIATDFQRRDTYVCISVVPVLSTGTKIIPVLAFLIPVPVLELELEQ